MTLREVTGKRKGGEIRKETRTPERVKGRTPPAWQEETVQAGKRFGGLRDLARRRYHRHD